MHFDSGSAVARLANCPFFCARPRADTGFRRPRRRRARPARLVRGCAWMFQLAVVTACQIPDRSGLPLAVRGSACPAAGTASAVMATADTNRPISRLVIVEARTLAVHPRKDGLAESRSKGRLSGEQRRSPAKARRHGRKGALIGIRPPSEFARSVQPLRPVQHSRGARLVDRRHSQQKPLAIGARREMDGVQ